MLGSIAKREKYIHIGKWQSNENRLEIGYVRFKIVQSDNSYNTDFNNIEGTEGTMIIETKSGLPFQIDDLFFFKGMKFNIVKIDSDMTKAGEQAYSRFKTTGNLITTLNLRKAG